jgi:hypothetical protein
MNGSFLFCFTPLTQGTVIHPSFVEIFSQVVSSKKASNYPGLHPIKDSSLILAAKLNTRSFLESVCTVTCKLCICLYDPLQPYILIKNAFYKFVKHKCPNMCYREYISWSPCILNCVLQVASKETYLKLN